MTNYSLRYPGPGEVYVCLLEEILKTGVIVNGEEMQTRDAIRSRVVHQSSRVRFSRVGRKHYLTHHLFADAVVVNFAL